MSSKTSQPEAEPEGIGAGSTDPAGVSPGVSRRGAGTAEGEEDVEGAEVGGTPVTQAASPPSATPKKTAIA